MLFPLLQVSDGSRKRALPNECTANTRWRCSSHPVPHWNSGMKLPPKWFYTKKRATASKWTWWSSWVGRASPWGLALLSPHGFHMAWLSHLEPAACCSTALVGQGDPAASSGESGVCTSENTGGNEHQVAKGGSQCWEVGGGSAEESTSSCAITGTSRGLHSQQKTRGWGSLVWWLGTRILGCPHTAWLQVPSLPHTTCVTLDKLLSLFFPQFPCL